MPETEENKMNVSNFEKLKWLGKPEQFGFILLELAKKGYIEIPQTNGEASYSKYAKVCYELFEFTQKTSQGNLNRAMNPKKNQLSESNRAKFVIPEMKDIS